MRPRSFPPRPHSSAAWRRLGWWRRRRLCRPPPGGAKLPSPRHREVGQHGTAKAHLPFVSGPCVVKPTTGGPPVTSVPPPPRSKERASTDATQCRECGLRESWKKSSQSARAPTAEARYLFLESRTRNFISNRVNVMTFGRNTHSSTAPPPHRSCLTEPLPERPPYIARRCGGTPRRNSHRGAWLGRKMSDVARAGYFDNRKNHAISETIRKEERCVVLCGRPAGEGRRWEGGAYLTSFPPTM